MNQLRQTIEKISPTNSRILIVGPAGAGKELTARAIHGQSARANGPFIVINAAAMMPERMEVELLARAADERGRTQGRRSSRRHMGGTLVIDLRSPTWPRETQNKICGSGRANVQRVSGTQKVQVDVAHYFVDRPQHRKPEIARRQVREDLYHRLSVVPIRVARRWPSDARIFQSLIEYFMASDLPGYGLPKRLIGEDATVLSPHYYPRMSATAQQWSG